MAGSMLPTANFASPITLMLIPIINMPPTAVSSDRTGPLRMGATNAAKRAIPPW